MMSHEKYLLLAMIFAAPHLSKTAGLILAVTSFAVAVVVALGAP